MVTCVVGDSMPYATTHSVWKDDTRPAGMQRVSLATVLPSLGQRILHQMMNLEMISRPATFDVAEGPKGFLPVARSDGGGWATQQHL